MHLLTHGRRTKIIATLGPAIDNAAALREMIQAGTDLFRANFSHGSSQQHLVQINMVREISYEVGREIAIIADLQGPKIRITNFKNDKIVLQKEQLFTLDCSAQSTVLGDENRVGLTYIELINDVFLEDDLLLDDGRIVLKVAEIDKKNSQIICQVIVGGMLSNGKGINRRGGGLSAPTLTAKDKRDLEIAVEAEVDYIALSFVRNRQDIEQARQLINNNINIIAKIERIEAIQALDEIIQSADAIMIARGDLGIEIDPAELPAVQKRIIHQARIFDKPVITATQMMESMLHETIPTRAEIFDVANAVLDMTDAVMLSAETATGAHPALVVETMSKICLAAEKQPETQISRHRVECYFHQPDEAIAMAAVYIANHLDIKAIISITASGLTPLRMSRIRTGIPIFAFTPHLKTARRVCLYRDVYPLLFDPAALDYSQQTIEELAIELLQNAQIVKNNDWVLITKGATANPGHTDMLRVHRVSAHNKK